MANTIFDKIWDFNDGDKLEFLAPIARNENNNNNNEKAESGFTRGLYFRELL